MNKLPKIGSICKVCDWLGHPFTKQFRGKTVEIIAHYTTNMDEEVAVFSVLGPKEAHEASYHALIADCFEYVDG